MPRVWILAALAALAAVAAALAPTAAHADNIAITAEVLDGDRTITLATLTPADFSNLVRGDLVDGALAVTVTETAATGDASWGVDVQVCGENDAADGPDCAGHANELRNAGGGADLGGANLTLEGLTVTPAVVALPALGAPAVAATLDAGLPATLSASRRLFTVTGQEVARSYSGTYVSTSTVSLDVPDDADPGTYNGYVVVTLVE